MEHGIFEHALEGRDDVEIVTKDRYALFRTTRIFADLVFMRDALRLAVHMKREDRRHRELVDAIEKHGPPPGWRR